MKGGNLILQASLELSPSQVARETSECFFSSLFCLPYDYFLKSVSCYERDKSNKQILFLSQAVAPASFPSLNQEEPSGSCAAVSLSPATRWRQRTGSSRPSRPLERPGWEWRKGLVAAKVLGAFWLPPASAPEQTRSWNGKDQGVQSISINVCGINSAPGSRTCQSPPHILVLLSP